MKWKVLFFSCVQIREQFVQIVVMFDRWVVRNPFCLQHSGDGFTVGAVEGNVKRNLVFMDKLTTSHINISFLTNVYIICFLHEKYNVLHEKSCEGEQT